jgi:hypothetical protein
MSFIDDRFECISVNSVNWLLASGVRFITSAVCCMLTCAVAVARMMAYKQPVYCMRCITTLRNRRALTTVAQAAAEPTAAYGGQQRQLAAAATTQLQTNVASQICAVHSVNAVHATGVVAVYACVYQSHACPCCCPALCRCCSSPSVLQAQMLLLRFPCGSSRP